MNQLSVSVIAALIAALALAVSFLSWRTAVRSQTASLFNRRFEIYSDAEKFLHAWMRDFRPDMDLLPTLVGAWNRSHFLCSEEVTTFLKKLWDDALKADRDHKVIAGEVQGDRKKALSTYEDFVREYGDYYAKLRDTFMHDLRVSAPRRIWQR